MWASVTSSSSVLMSALICVLLQLNLYIILVNSLSVVSQNHHASQHQLKTSEDLHGHTRPRPRSAPLMAGDESPRASRQQPTAAPSVASRDNKMDDLFLVGPSITEKTDQQQQQQHPQHLKQFNNLADYNTINLDNSLAEVESDLMINNHQSASMIPSETVLPSNTTSLENSSQDSRHYSQAGLNLNEPERPGASMQSNYLYQAAPSKHRKQHHSQAHYGKYSPNMFANNYNLNYIHGFLANKPSLLPSGMGQSTSSASLPPVYSLHGASTSGSNANSLANQYNAGTQPGMQTGSYNTGYISASSVLSAAVSNLQVTIAQKQQQLDSINNQLKDLANAAYGGQASASSTPTHSSFGRDSLPHHHTGPSNVAYDLFNGNHTTNNEDSFPEVAPSFKCGRQQVVTREPRVVGGNSTYEGEFPWAVSIQRHGNHHCGGVIVDRRWILTAAHCVRSQLVGNLAVRTGGHTLTRSPNGLNSHLERDYQVEQIVMHDDFSRYDNLTALQSKSSANTNNADIALLKLKQDIHWNDLAWPVCFPERDAGNFSGHDAVVIGWGKLNEKSEEFSNELQKVKLTIIDNKVCQNWFRQAGRDMPIDDRIICAGFKHGGKDACHGDSGGPLLSRINGQYVVVGVVSTGIGCARPLLPGLYSRVSSYIGWIERYVAP